MLTITDAAGAYLTEMLQKANAPEGVVVRIVFGFHGLEFQPSATCPGDTTFDFGGKTVLVLDKHLSTALSAKTLDTRKMGERVTLDLV